MPEVAITADVMVGFPGESEAEHAESLALIREMAFSEQHVFRYSSRPGTAAARLPDDVPPQVKKRRSEEVSGGRWTCSGRSRPRCRCRKLATWSGPA
jgi:threonylcarbamoyladenosine tRNA methylthiotransferase MtaB